MPPIVHLIVPEGPRQGTRPVYRPVLPRGLLQIARGAEDAGWDATVLDGYSAPHLLDAYFEILAEGRGKSKQELPEPNLVGISIHGPPALEPALMIAERLRQIAPELPLLFGGQLANVDAELILPYLPPRSLLSSGAGGSAVAGILDQALRAGNEASLLQQGGVPPWRALPAQELLLPDYSSYLRETDFEYHLETQVGCPYRCFHCGTGRKGLYAKTINRPLEAIQRELDGLEAFAQQADTRLPRLWVTDETFGSDPEHARAFCEALISRPGPWRWRAQSRPDAVSEPVLERMRAAGCDRLALGVEIPSDAGLALLGKREAMEDGRRAFQACRSQGLDPEAIIVVGTPGDSSRPEDFLEALDMLEAASVQAYIYHPVPGSPWWKRYGAEFLGNSTAPSRWSDLDFHSPPVGVSESDAERAVIAFLALHLWRPAGIRRALPAPPVDRWRPDCPRCGFHCEPEVMLNHQPTGIQIRRCSLDEKVAYIGTGPGIGRLLVHDPAVHRNLYSGLYSMNLQKPDLPLCPRCWLSDSGREHSAARGNAGFQAV